MEEEDRKFGLVDWGLILVFLLLPLEAIGVIHRGGGGGGYAGGLTYAKLAILGTIGLWFVKVIFTRDFYPIYSFYSNFTSLSLAAGILVGITSAVTTRHHPYFRGILIQAVSLAMLYFLMINVIKYKQRLFKWAFGALLVGSLFSSLGGGYEMLTGDMIMKGRLTRPGTPAALSTQHGFYQTEFGRNRIASFSGDCGMHGVHWAVYGCFFLAIPFLFDGFWKKTLAWGATILTILNCIAPGSRSGMAGLAVGGLIFFIFVKIRFRFFIATLALLGVLVFAVLAHAPLERIFNKGTRAQISVEMRGAQSKVALNMVRDHPILGVGMGNYVGLYYLYNRTIPTAPKTPTIMHDGYLAVWAEQGTLGLIVFITTFASVLVVLVQVYRNPANRYVEFISLGLLSGLAAHMVTQLGYPLLGDEFGYFILGFGVALKAVNNYLLGLMPEVAIATK